MMDAACAAAQSDPDKNPQFRRWWTWPPLKREHPADRGNDRGGAHIEAGSSAVSLPRTAHRHQVPNPPRLTGDDRFPRRVPLVVLR
jgi:hypothetical protein